jgi:hypothetical protein
MIHANGADIPFEPKYVMQLHGTMHRYVGTRDAGKWKTVDNTVTEKLSDASTAVRFVPVKAMLTAQAMDDPTCWFQQRAIRRRRPRAVHELPPGDHPRRLRRVREPHRHDQRRSRVQEGAHHHVHRLADGRRVHGRRCPQSRARCHRRLHQQGSRGAPKPRPHPVAGQRAKRPLATAHQGLTGWARGVGDGGAPAPLRARLRRCRRAARPASSARGRARGSRSSPAAVSACSAPAG